MIDYDSDQNWSIDCVCALDSSCQTSSAIYYQNFDWKSKQLIINYVLPGWSIGCFEMRSLLFSTLECLYVDSECLSVILIYVKNYALESDLQLDLFIPQPLVYNPQISRFPPNTTIETILADLMIEHLNVKSSYVSYYATCSPAYCSYSYVSKKQNFWGLIVTMISMINGLSVALRFIALQLVKFIYFLINKVSQRRRSGNICLLVRFQH